MKSFEKIKFPALHRIVIKDSFIRLKVGRRQTFAKDKEAKGRKSRKLR